MFGHRDRNNRARNQDRHQPPKASYQPRYGGSNNSRHSFAGKPHSTNLHDGFTDHWKTVHPTTDDLTDVNPERRAFLLEDGQGTLPRAYMVTKREQSSTPATVEHMDLTM
jgi:hypothetical protein